LLCVCEQIDCAERPAPKEEFSHREHPGVCVFRSLTNGWRGGAQNRLLRLLGCPNRFRAESAEAGLKGTDQEQAGVRPFVFGCSVMKTCRLKSDLELLFVWKLASKRE
jgi:hypothetical protein